MLSKKNPLDHEVEAMSQMNQQWWAWLRRAKLEYEKLKGCVVVPEVLKKFCNEHKDPAWRGRLTEYDKGYSDCCIAVLEMIEAQEPAND